MKRILMTGATGAVGTHLVPRMIARGWQVICVLRARNGRGPQRRLQDEFGSLSQHLIALEGDIRKPFLGLSETQQATLRGTVATALNGAASVTFDEEAWSETWNSNVEGTRNFLDLAGALEITGVHHISTAYVAGDAPRFLETDMDCGQRFRNPYEASKLHGERQVRTRFPGAFSIYRPSIVVGDSVNGFIRNFNGYYGFAKAWHQLARCLKRLPALPAGIMRTGDRIHLPLVLRSRPSATLNLVPVDWIADSMARLLDIPPHGRCYHLIQPQPITMETLAEASLHVMGIQGVRMEPGSETGEVETIQSLQRRLDYHLSRYESYLQGEPDFGYGAIIEDLGSGYIEPPRVDQSALRRLLDYAVAAKWRAQPAPHLLHEVTL